MSDTKDLDARRSRLTPEQRAKLDARLKAQPHTATTTIPRRHLKQDIPLSPSQRGLWLTWKLDPESPAYNMPGALYLKGQLDIPALESSLRALVTRHETLRTVIQEHEEDEARQCVLPDAGIESSLSFRILDLRDFANNAEQQTLVDHLKDFAQHPFNLHADIPFRAVLFQTAAHEYCLGLCLHHIAGDGWSIAILINELFALYESFHARQEHSLPALPIQFSDYVVWQKEWFDSSARQRQLDYWMRALHGEHEPITLPLVNSRESNQHRHEARYAFSLSPTLSDDLREFARAQGVSLYMVVLALLKFTLYRFSGQSDIRVGAPVANRQQEETRGVVGYLLNLLVLRTQINASDSFATLLTHVRDTLIDAQSHQELPFDVVVDALQPERIAGVHPLFQVKCTQQDNLATHRTLAGLDIDIEFIATERAHFDLSLDFTDRTQHIECVLIYTADLLAVHTITDFANTLQEAARQFIHTPDLPLALFEFPNSSSRLVGHKTAALFNSVVDSWKKVFFTQATRVAIQDSRKSLTYAELDNYSTQLAAQLVKSGVVAETRVAIHAERRIEFVVAVVAVLKAGGTYVPLDPALPADRLAYQIEDSNAALLLSTESMEWNPNVPVLLLNDEVFSGTTSELPDVAIHPQQAAYVIYTSGSTGKPKGVVVNHGALANYVQALLTRLSLPDSVQSMAMVSTVAADLGNTVLFGALCSGRTLHLISPECAFDPDAFATYMHRHRIDVLKIVPSHLQALLNAAHPEQVLPETCLIVGGETTRWSLLKQINALKPACRVLNHYGPTETAVGVLTQEAYEAQANASGLPIGQPLANNQVYVLDAELNPVPLGVAGELYVGGQQLACGYQSRASQTAERFIANPFDNGERLYRTGDRVRMLGDNSLEFLGRVDDQIKVRGYRVELCEIAQALRALSGVAQAEAIARENSDGQAKLYGYVVAQPDAVITAKQLHDALHHTLPDYMVPDAIQLLESLPLTANGKLDRKSLPDPEQQELKNYIAPQGETEEILAEIWCEVLGVDQVGRHDNFFALGGDSILSLKVVARVRKRGLKLAPKQLFEQPSLMSAAQVIAKPESEHKVVSIPVLTEAQRKQSLPLSYAQSRQWFLWQLDPQSSAYHISGALHLKGQLNVTALKSSFVALAARHESLRTLFRSDAHGLVEQIVVDEADIAFEDIDAMTIVSRNGHDVLTQTEIARLQQTPFDLEQGPLLRVGLIQQAADDYVLVVVMHHIISDGWSMQVLIDEFALLYRAEISGEDAGLPVLPIHYIDYAVWQRDWLSAEEKTRQLDYWKHHLGYDHTVLQLPTDYPRRADGRYRAKSRRLLLPQALVGKIRQQSETEGATLFVWLLAAFYALLNKYTGVDDVRVGVPIANRHLPQTEGIVGFFVNTQVLRAMLDNRMSLAQLFAHVKNVIAAAQDHQDLPFDQLVEALQPERTLTHSPLFQVMFNHQRKSHQALAHLPNLAMELYNASEKSALFELMVDSVEWPDGSVSIAISYAEELFSPEWINGLTNTYLHLLNSLVETPQSLLGNIALMASDEKAIVARASASEWRGSGNTFAHHLFEVQVVRNPAATAVVFAQQHYSYGEINSRANCLARLLMDAGVGPEVRVGVMLTRSEKTIISLLAILKAGGVYVPLDPEYPANRLQYMVENSGIELLLTQDDLAERMYKNPAVPLKLLRFNDLDLASATPENPNATLHVDNLAYILYTSGSTGQPKGIAMSHRVLGQLVEWQLERYPERYNTLLFASPCFDVGIQEIMTGLGCGATLVQTGNEDRHNFAALFELVKNHNVARIYLPFSVLQLYADLALTSGIRQPQLRQVITAGEQLKLTPLLIKWLEQESQCELLNQYGPTETHVVSEYAINNTMPRVELPPIGTPVSTAHLYILDSSLQKVPVGVPGELYIGSSVLARGYVSRPLLSAERFIADPFDGQGGRLYRTGDLVKCNRDGQIEYIGRIDAQIKLRGFRIEPGEIETQLLAQPEVREAAVVIKKLQGKDLLVAYFSLQENMQLDGMVLRDRLRQSLADYMVPGKFVILNNLPLNANGKIDRRALPELQVTSDEHQTPVGETEVRLAHIWSAVLGIDTPGRHDNFFELGGHSLQIIQVVSRVQFEFSVRLSVRDVFQNPALAGMAVMIDGQLSAQPATDTLAELGAFIDSLETV